jgi:hypothetical protein
MTETRVNSATAGAMSAGPVAGRCRRLGNLGRRRQRSVGWDVDVGKRAGIWMGPPMGRGYRRIRENQVTDNRLTPHVTDDRRTGDRRTTHLTTHLTVMDRRRTSDRRTTPLTTHLTVTDYRRTGDRRTTHLTTHLTLTGERRTGG